MEKTARHGRELIEASRPFTKESRLRSWWVTLSTFALLGAAHTGAVLLPWWPARIAAAILAGLLIVRAFIIYHDYMHNAILKGSLAAKPLFWLYGLLVLNPPRVWRQTHNYHHTHNAKIIGSHVGSYAMVTLEMWEKMNASQQRMYRIIRHPLTVLFGYFTIFLYGMCISPFRRNPRRLWDGALAFVLHVGLTVALLVLFGWQVWLLGLFVPLFVAHAMGAYLFYAQHNFPDVDVRDRRAWEYTHAALHSSSYMKTGAVMAYFTGNIGYHHVHHLNSKIPFYRLPEAMAAIPELQDPPTTTLWPSDIIACFRVKLWDPDSGQMVGYPATK